MFLNKFKRVLEYASNKELLIARLKKLPISFFEDLLELKRILPVIDNIFDIGANDGEFTIAANYVYPKSKIYCFEPLPEKAKKLKEIYAINRVMGEIYDIALSSSKGRAVFYQYKYDRLSSFLTPGTKLKQLFGDRSQFNEITVQKDLFDNIFELKQNEKTLVKIDTQGSELDVLKGMVKNLKYINAILCEVNFDNLYMGQTSFIELISFLYEYEFRRFYQLDKAVVNGTVSWCDLVFMK